MAKAKGPRGTPDLFPPDSELLSELEDVARTLFERYGYRRVETPAFEHTEVFERSAGDSADIVVQKQMYTFEDAGRPLTPACVRRARPVLSGRSSNIGRMESSGYATALLHRSVLPLRAAGQGVERQFSQPASSGSARRRQLWTPRSFALARDFFQTIGSRRNFPQHDRLSNDRAGVPTALKASLATTWTSFVTTVTDASRRTDACVRLQGARRPEDHPRARACRSRLDTATSARVLRRSRTDTRVSRNRNGRTIRGWYEVSTLHAHGLRVHPSWFFKTLGAGGRYDLLIEQFGGPSMPAIGFGLGLTRSIRALTRGPTLPWRPDVHVVWLEGLAEVAVALAMDLRRAGLRVTVSDEARSMKSQLREADRLGAKQVGSLGLTKQAGRLSRSVSSIRASSARSPSTIWPRSSRRDQTHGCGELRSSKVGNDVNSRRMG